MESCKHCEEGGWDCQGCQSQSYSCCACLEKCEGKEETCETSAPVRPTEVATGETEGAREPDDSAAPEKVREGVVAEGAREPDGPRTEAQRSAAAGEESEPGGSESARGERDEEEEVESHCSEGSVKSYCSVCWYKCWQHSSDSDSESSEEQESPAPSGDDEEDGSEGSRRSYCSLCWSKCWETGSRCNEISKLARDQELPAPCGEDGEPDSDSDSCSTPDFDALSCCSSVTERSNGTEHYTDDQLFYLAKGEDDFVREAKRLVDRAKDTVRKLGIEIEWESNADLALILGTRFVSTYNCRLYLNAHCRKVSEFLVHVMAHLARNNYHTLGGFICREKCILILPRQLDWGKRPPRRRLSSTYGRNVYVLSSGKRSTPH